MKKVVKIYIGNKVFECIDYTFNSPRMGSAPTITTKLKSFDSLDSDIKDSDVYAEYNGEKYLLLNTPKSSKGNEDARFEYDLSFVAGRFILDNIYLHDTELKTTEIRFSGTIKEYANYLNKSLEYSGLPYRVFVDNGIESESKFFSLTDTAISSAIQESYKQYEIPYYYVGEEIHFGYASDVINHVFKYGIDDGLLKISKSPEGNKIINRATGVGSEENIPYYYPNEHPLGIVDTYYTPNDGEKALRNDLVVNNNKFAEKVKNSSTLSFDEKGETNVFFKTKIYYHQTYWDWECSYVFTFDGLKSTIIGFVDWFVMPDVLRKDVVDYFKVPKIEECGRYDNINLLTEAVWLSRHPKNNIARFACIRLDLEIDETVNNDSVIKFSHDLGKDNKYNVNVKYYIAPEKEDISGAWSCKGIEFDNRQGIAISEFKNTYKKTKQAIDETQTRYYVYAVLELLDDTGGESVPVNIKFHSEISPPIVTQSWYNEQGSIVRLDEYGLSLNDTPSVGDKITFQTKEGSLIPFQNTLMPPRYRENQDVYYNAVNDTYELPDGGGTYEFDFPYSSNDIREHKETFDFIKPSIEYVKYNHNGKELPVNMFVEFAYDEYDNDEVNEEKNEHIHPYFFGKLRPLGFNLFDSANEKGEMTISMTSGSCGACNFVIGVDENTKRNIVQVDDNGNLLREENGNVKFGLSQEIQNDTTNNYVWIALKKDTETYTNIRPNATYKRQPKACSAIDATDGDTFVILNITLPSKYIVEAEKELEREIIAYLKENNDEKFSFSIKFSRIFLAKNPSIANALNENARVQIEYNNTTIPFYITSYTYKCVGNEALPEISVELSEELKFSEGFLHKTLSSVEKSVLSKVGDMDFAAQGMKYFLRKDVNDVANGLIRFKKGATFGANENAKFDEQGNADFVSQIIHQYISTPQFIDGFVGTGFKLWFDEETRKSNLTVDNITARETFRVFEMLVTKLRAVNGGLFVSAANGVIKEVVDSGEYYDIILENNNTFVAGDYMRCKVMSGLNTMGYWVEIESTNGNVCRVLKSEFGDVMPLVGQDVVLDGSRKENRQGAIYITANEDGFPRIEVLNGISTKSHNGCLKTRLGSLNDIVDATFGGKLSGYGLYSDNAYLKGDFVLKNGEKNIETVFAIQDGKIKSGIAQTQAEALRGKTLLYNASFIDGLNGWLTSNEDSVYFSGNSLLFSGSSLLTQSVKISNEPIFDNVFFLTINNGWIEQGNYFFVNKPAFDSSKFYPLYFSANMRCRTAGTLTVKLAKTGHTTTIATQDYEEGQIYGYGRSAHDFKAFVVKKTVSSGDVLVIEDDKIYNITKQETFVHEYIDTTSFAVLEILQEDDLPILTKDIQPNNEFFEVNRELMWNGTGDFYLSFTGEADFYGLTIYTEKTEVRHKTFFEMSDRLIEFGARQLNSDGTISKESGIVVKPNASGIYAIDGDGNTAKIGVYTEDGSGVIKLSADKIFLDGKITANGKVEIADGKIKAQEAELINANFLSGKDTNDFYLKINNQGLQSILSSDLGDRLYMQLSTAQVTFGVPTFAPRLLFTNGYTSSNESIVCNTILMYNQLYINEQTNPDEMGLTKYQNRRLSATCGSLQITKNIDGTTTMVAITPDYIQLNGYKITVGEDGSIKTKKV